MMDLGLINDEVEKDDGRTRMWADISVYIQKVL